MNRAIRFVCLAVASFAFLTFTFIKADEQRQRSTGTQEISLDTRAQSSGPLQGSKPLVPQPQAEPKLPGTQTADPGTKPKSSGPILKPITKKYTPAKFIKLERDKNKKPKALQTSIVRYVPSKGNSGVVVDLVGVVHVGDRQYYNELNKIFEDYDVVLYELVAPKGVRPSKTGKKSDNPLSMLQDILTLVLQLDLQTRCIDYTCTNFVHADLSPNEMGKIIKKRGDNALSLGLSIVADMIREQNKMELKAKQNPGFQQPNIDPFNLMFDPQAPAKLKIIMAEQMEQAGDGAGLGKTLNQLLIDDRNAACMKVFQQQLVQGKKKIAIFYGAAHMPDFERRLIQDYGMQQKSVQWLDAWDLRPRQMNPLDLLKLLD